MSFLAAVAARAAVRAHEKRKAETERKNLIWRKALAKQHKEHQEESKRLAESLAGVDRTADMTGDIESNNLISSQKNSYRPKDREERKDNFFSKLPQPQDQGVELINQEGEMSPFEVTSYLARVKASMEADAAVIKRMRDKRIAEDKYR